MSEKKELNKEQLEKVNGGDDTPKEDTLGNPSCPSPDFDAIYGVDGGGPKDA